MKCKELIELLECRSPEYLACDWDNVGLLVGSLDKEVTRIYLAVDATDTVIADAVRQRADLLLTHHPMIFKGLKKITAQDFIGRRVIALIRHDLAYYAMHTNFDVTHMAELAAKKMGLTEDTVLQKTADTAQGPVGIGRVGNLPDSKSLEECIQQTKAAFQVETVKVFASHGRDAAADRQLPVSTDMVDRIALCPGSGKSVIEDAIKAGAQVLITGDIDHHEGIDAAARGLAVIDAGHYGMEKMFVPCMEQYLKEKLPELIVTTETPEDPFFYI